jgi:hypothetical protein
MKLLQMFLPESPCCPQPKISPQGRSRLSARQGSCLVLPETWGWSVGTVEKAGWQEGEAATRKEGGLAFFKVEQLPQPRK